MTICTFSYPLALEGIHARVAYEPDGGPIMQVDLYSNAETARKGGTTGLLAEDCHRQMTMAQLQKICERVSEHESNLAVRS